MTKPQQQFLELLRSGLWGKPADASIFQGEIDWNSILRIAKEQTVQVLVANGIETLPKELWPPKVVIFKLMEIKTKTAKMHLLLNSVLAKITTALNAEGIPSVLLKGQGLAQNYLVPESRICGDIDLYVGEENVDKAYDIIAVLSNEPIDLENKHPENGMHLEIKVDGVVVEIHKKALATYSSRVTRLLKTWTQNNLDANFHNNELPSINFDLVPVKVPSADFNAVFILYHAAHHMRVGGIGLRQLCDWATYLSKHHLEINTTELKKTLRRFNMLPVWKEFGKFAINILGLDTEYLPLAPRNLNSTKETEFILTDIFATGNFGHYRQFSPIPPTTHFIKRKWLNGMISTRRFVSMVKLFPGFTISYSIGWYRKAFRRLIQGK